jgi:glycerol-3-phosphate cytidylyltransferase
MKIGITASAFDVLHAGHVSMLEEARSHCDFLICALHIDPSIERPEKSPPMQSVVERYTQLRAVEFVDEIIPYQTESDLLDILQLRKIDVRIIGEEYKDVVFTGRHLCEKLGIKIIYNLRSHRFSSTLKRKVLTEGRKNGATELQDGPDR